MPDSFSQTLRSLSADGPGRWAFQLLPALALLTLWTTWLLTATVAVYEVSADARLAASRGSLAVESPADGRLSAVRVRLGQEVAAGQLLFELDAADLTAERADRLAAAAHLARQLDLLDAQLAALRQASAGAVRADAAALGAAAARSDEARAAVQLAADQARRTAALQASGFVAAAEADRVLSDLHQREAAAAALAADLDRLRWQRRGAAADREAALLALAASRGRLAGELAAARAAAARLARDISRLAVRAPLPGTIAELPAARPGLQTLRGARLATLVPSAPPLVVAAFPAAAAARLRPGQTAWVTLGADSSWRRVRLPATVRLVAGEGGAAPVRVELALHAVRPGRDGLPLRSGLPATVAVQTERLSALALVLRAAGQLLPPS